MFVLELSNDRKMNKKAVLLVLPGIIAFDYSITKYFKNEWMILKIFQIRRLLCILKALSIGCENRQIWIYIAPTRAPSEYRLRK